MFACLRLASDIIDCDRTGLFPCRGLGGLGLVSGRDSEFYGVRSAHTDCYNCDPTLTNACSLHPACTHACMHMHGLGVVSTAPVPPPHPPGCHTSSHNHARM